jgi:hypothetical protein
MRFASLALLLIGILTNPGAAQAADGPRYQVAAGYAFLHDEDISDNLSRGWVASVAGNIKSWLGLVGEVGGNYRTLSVVGDPPRLTVYGFMGGPRFTVRAYPRLAPFAQVLVGAVLASSGVGDWDADFAYQPGGGISLHLKPRVGVRLEGDYRIIRSSGNNSKEPRFVAAAIFWFGR